MGRWNLIFLRCIHLWLLLLNDWAFNWRNIFGWCLFRDRILWWFWRNVWSWSALSYRLIGIAKSGSRTSGRVNSTYSSFCFSIFQSLLACRGEFQPNTFFLYLSWLHRSCIFLFNLLHHLCLWLYSSSRFNEIVHLHLFCFF